MAITGKINVQTENIFPIIKKFLYSDHEIFLRELVSNAVDATQKLKVFSSMGDFKGSTEDLRVEVIIDEEAKTLTIRDNGIGMNSEEIDKYINEIAFSGAQEFVDQYKDKEGADAIIGHFGLGFYSAFMVADKVEIKTLSFKENSQAVQWESNGNTEYTITEIDKETSGTDIVLHITEESKEFLEKARISGILSKYCKFLPVEIKFGTNERTEKEKDEEGKEVEGGTETKIIDDNIINNTKPAWTVPPADLSAEDYDKFYNELYPFTEDPLFHIHLNVDYPFNLTGILYFPKLKKSVEVQKNKIQLYSNQVFITDSVEEIVPEFLTLLHGVIDSPDIPLNVSRSYLQSDGNVKKISNHISKKVADKLAEMFKNDREDFEQKWDDVSVFIQYGMLSDDKFYDRSSKFALLKNTEGKCFTFSEYADKVNEIQKNKEGKNIYLYTNDKEGQHTFIKSARDKGYDVLELEGPLSSHWIGQLEQKLENVSFSRVDSDTIEKLIQKDEEIPSKLSKEEEEKILPFYQDTLDKVKFTVVFESRSETESPIVITQSEFMRRMKEQQALGGGGMNVFGSLPENYSVVVNSNHSLTSKVLGASEEEGKELAKQAIDLALLSQGMLTGKNLTEFIDRSLDLLK